MYTNNGRGNELLTNLPRKINIALSGSRDDFPHTHINDVGLVAARHPATGEVGVLSTQNLSEMRHPIQFDETQVSAETQASALLLISFVAARHPGICRSLSEISSTSQPSTLPLHPSTKQVNRGTCCFLRR